MIKTNNSILEPKLLKDGVHSVSRLAKSIRIRLRAKQADIFEPTKEKYKYEMFNCPQRILFPRTHKIL